MRPRILVRPPGPKARAIIRRDQKVVSRSAARNYPLVIDRAYGANIQDVDGNIYIDFSSAVAVMNAGFSNPQIIDAVAKQLPKATHAAFLDFYAETPVRFIEELRSSLSRQHKYLDRIFLSNSGTEAVETGMKLSRWYTQRRYFLAFYGGFHGRTYGSLSMTSTKAIHRAGFGPFLDVVHAPYPNPYRCPFDSETAEACAQTALGHIEDNIFKKETPASEFAAVFVEPIQGEGAYVVPPKSFLKGLQKLCRNNGILFAVDEVQTGAWRTGKFLASEHFGIKPDIVAMAKAIGGGLPLGATLANKKIMSWPRGSHASTFGGNMLSCAAGTAALKFMRQSHIGKEVEKKGAYIIKYLRDLQQECKIIGDVRGIGLMIGIELVRDHRSKTPAESERDKALRQAFENGLVLLPAGISTIRVAPPLIISKEDVDAGLEILRATLLKVDRERI